MAPEPGLYLGMSADEYHATPALSNSVMKWLRVSALDCWARTPWLNPDAEEEKSPFMELGTAYHRRIVEGREAFQRDYAPQLDPDDYPSALRTMDDIKDALRELGQPVGGNKAQITQRLLENDPTAQVWDKLVADHTGDHAGKTMLAPEQIRRIEIAAAMIENDPELSKAFSGGHPEVTVIWIDPETEVLKKARFDYLKPRAVVELKTFGNAHGRPVDRAITTAFANGRYHLQAAHYLDAADQAAEHIREGRVFGEADPAWLKSVAAAQDRVAFFVFQQTGPAPVARGKVFPRGLVYDCAKIAIRDATALYAACLEKYGPDPWVDPRPISTFDDNEFPMYAVE